MSDIIMGKGDNYEQMAQEAAMDELQEKMFTGLVDTVTKNVIGNLLNCPMGIVYLDENGKQTEKEKSLGFEPVRQNERDSGYDLISPIDFTLSPGERKIIGLKIGLLIPSHMDMLILTRSGNASKMGIMVVNSPGLVDNSYVGYEIKVILTRLDDVGAKPWNVKRGDRIAQARFQLKGASMYIKEFKESLSELQDRISRKGGLGSTDAPQYKIEEKGLIIVE